MNLKKIDTLIIKGLRSVNPNDILYGIHDESIVVIDRGIRLFLIDKDAFLFDTFYKDREYVNVEKLLDKSRIDSYHWADRTVFKRDILNSVDKKHTTVVKISNGEHYAWVDERLLKEFDSELSVFKINNPTDPVYVFEGDKLVGLVLPTRVNETEE